MGRLASAQYDYDDEDDDDDDNGIDTNLPFMFVILNLCAQVYPVTLRHI